MKLKDLVMKETYTEVSRWLKRFHELRNAGYQVNGDIEGNTYILYWRFK